MYRLVVAVIVSLAIGAAVASFVWADDEATLQRQWQIQAYKITQVAEHDAEQLSQCNTELSKAQNHAENLFTAVKRDSNGVIINSPPSVLHWFASFF